MPSRAVTAFPPQGHNHRRCVRTALETAERQCRERGMRLTPIRRRVLELVWRKHSPVGAYQLLDALAHDGKRPTPPTVYRALDFLMEAGLVHRLASLNAYVGCVDPSQPHASQFLICTDCGEVAELSGAHLGRAIDRRAGELGFVVGSHRIEVSGLCERCVTLEAASK